ncbi:ABC transporter substrate-binding protein [Meiothermus granaticius]|uniref:Cyclodextrin-binding protein n=1 Tax=Meiothermus granaticius NBRC 107808 TaxID=1227551 RepID=A0A399FAM5_9DEIN|nr:sugar ABC transporter substrate-binding protein [Meiothermus granaticius]RIH93278.1 Cyclodextrin-binding protein [Meiothermus granaticius NBRC 107808]GEM85915.1 sugar ABC transporter substrate-binding protein [Meiothermus granaticius NBRC 107808]
MNHRWLLVFGLSIGLIGVPSALAQRTLEFVTTNLQTFADFFNPLMERFQKANPGLSLKWTDLPQNAIQQKILAGVATGNPPDAVQMNSDQILVLAQQGALLPLNELLPPETFKLYQKPSLEAFTFEGKIYGLPDYASTRIVAFNTEILRKAGLDPSNPPKTIPGVIEWAKTIKDKTGIYGFAPLISGVDFLKTFQEAGLPIFDEKRRKAVFNSPAHVALLQQYVDLRKKDYFPEDVMRRGFTAAYELYTAGKLGIIIIGPQFMPRLEKDNNAVWKVTTVAPHPVGAGQVVQASTFAYAVPKGVRDPKAAAALAAWLTDDQNQLLFSKRTETTFPTTVKAAQDPYFSSGGGDLNAQARLAAAKTMRLGRDLSVSVPNSAALNKVFKDNLEAAIFGQKSAKQALDDIVKFWNANL